MQPWNPGFLSVSYPICQDILLVLPWKFIQNSTSPHLLHGYHPDPSHHFFSSEKPHWGYFHPWFFAFCSWHSSQCNYYFFLKSTNYIKLFLNKGPFWSDSALPLWSPHPFVYCALDNQFLTELARPTCTPGPLQWLCPLLQGKFLQLSTLWTPCFK